MPLFSKGVLLHCKTSPFEGQKESFWIAKQVLLEGKRSPFGIRNFEFLNFELFSATPAILNYSIFDF